MILSCNSCNKKFVVPDRAITQAGRTVQCGSCGNKWKQFPIKKEIKETKIEKEISVPEKTTATKIPKTKKSNTKKTREINLYSPEYLRKKHGINLNNIETSKIQNTNKNVSFGFYNSLIIFVFMTIFVSRGLYFLQDFIAQSLPFTKFYLDYFFESIRNLFEIWKNLFSSY